MSIDPIHSLMMTQNYQSLEFSKTEPVSFGNWLENKILETNTELNNVDATLTHLASGHVENLHQTMLTLEQAKLSFTYLEQIRNRLMSAYQEILREQI